MATPRVFSLAASWESGENMPHCRPRRRTVRFCVFVILLTLTFAVSASAAAPERVELTILHTNDIHGHVFPFDYQSLGKLETDVGGAARRATLIRRIKKETGHPVLVMDAGDLFARGPLADLKGQPDFEIQNAVPYDIMTLGNHEFDGAPGQDGLNNMLARIKQAGFPIVCANVFDKATGKTIVPPYQVMELGGVRIGVMGLTTSCVAQYGQAKTLDVIDPIETAHKIVPELRTKCDFIVALTHIGYPLDVLLAAAVPDIDVIVGGHTHTWLFQPTVVGKTIICQDGEWGKCLGRLDLELRASDRRYVTESHTASLIEIDKTVPAAKDVQLLLDRCTAQPSEVVGSAAAQSGKLGR